ncbi:hypothetical protein [Psychrobacter sp. 230]|mgnify:FL=1|uniref:hypothetical protein n=1 Tax=Psychrobacter sp. 230 TaxID=2555884 RepID=UPI00106882FA|nr:hypothetical protein [Psychrobacter sp. 230]TEW87180.1 hypothetical protein E2545_06305 [Psychrobacter sp. 230]|tara:strand:- start:23452 stop:23928 length:477 start_codon:yes stop_codon:yes gene_type:complete
MNNFALCPLQRGYAPEVANNILEQELMGGFARQRVQFINNVHTVTASVMLDDKGKQQYWWAFWRSHQENPRPFLWRLIVDDTEMTTYVCQFVAGSLRINERDGKVYSVSFGLRLKPNNTGTDFDETIIGLWESGDPRKLLNLLEKLVNEDLPDALGGL